MVTFPLTIVVPILAVNTEVLARRSEEVVCFFVSYVSAMSNIEVLCSESAPIVTSTDQHIGVHTSHNLRGTAQREGEREPGLSRHISQHQHSRNQI